MADERPLEVALENRLMSHGIYVRDLERLDDDDDGGEGDGSGDCREDDGGEGDGSDRAAPIREQDGADVRLEYETIANVERVTSDEVGAVVRTVLAVADERAWTPGRVEATSLTTTGDERGRWHVAADWFEQLHEGLTEVEFSQRVLETIHGQDGTR